MASIGVEEGDIKKLNSSITKDGDVKGSLGPEVSKWLSNTGVKALKGGLNVGKDVAVSLMTKALMNYYHLNN